MSRHIKSIHEGFRIECEQCDYMTSDKSNLLNHIKSTHKGVRFHCEHCDFQGTTKYFQKKHNEKQHNAWWASVNLFFSELSKEIYKIKTFKKVLSSEQFHSYKMWLWA